MSAERRTIRAAGHTWVHVERGTGPGCWHLDHEGGRCLSLQGVLDEHEAWVWAQARSGDRDRQVETVRSALVTHPVMPRVEPGVLQALAVSVAEALQAEEVR